jgi:hypothetical protein
VQAPAAVKGPLELSKWQVADSLLSVQYTCNIDREFAVDQDYKLLNQKGTVAEVTTWSDEKEFADMHEALLKLGFSEEQVLGSDNHCAHRTENDSALPCDSARSSTSCSNLSCTWATSAFAQARKDRR